MPRTLRRLPLFLLLLGVALGTPFGSGASADDPDLGDQTVPFVDQVNMAIEGGVQWLRARPDVFTMAGTDPEGLQAAWWGHIDSPTLYGGGTGPGYWHPAGPTALALYTLLKCGVDPDDPAIEKGFNWLRETHEIDPKWDGFQTSGRSWKWNHTAVASSYELSAMILALTAKYDPHKKSSQTRTARRHGHLKIRDHEDRRWLIKLVNALVDRRGRPGQQPIDLTQTEMDKIGRLDKEKYVEDNLPPAQGLDPPEQRRGWRYNVPNVNLRWGSPSKGGGAFNRGGARGVFRNEDLSSTQLAALALFAAHQFGVEADLDVWFDIIAFTLEQQEESGPEHERHDPGYSKDGYAAPVDHARGFVYIKGSPEHAEGKATGSMTACGIANLLMAKEAITSSPKGKKAWGERALDRKVEVAIWDGLAWLDLHWSSFNNPMDGGFRNYHTYYLYSIERAQDLRGKELLGAHLWYREGAQQLLGHQQHEKRTDPFDSQEKSGVFWNTNSTHDPKDVLDTCFALLFLKRATRDVAPMPITPGE